MKPEDLTDEQLIEAVATQVMGYDRQWFTVCKGGLDLSEGHRNEPLWNPLNDWNHTMEVREKANVQVDFNQGLAFVMDREDVGFVQFAEDDLDEGDLEEGEEPLSTQRAICLAALKALSPPTHEA